MIDIHCHIIPGIDDGARSFDESLEILKKAENSGVTDIILTPHYVRGTRYDANNHDKWLKYQELVKLAKEAGLSVRLYLGNEIFIDEKIPEYLKGYTGQKVADEDRPFIYDLCTLNSTKYVLVEFPVQFKDSSAKSTLFNLISEGFKPVIAHPCRYHYAWEDPNYFDDFLQMGCLLQGDYLALTRKYGKNAEKTLKKLLVAGKIFCLASDIHHSRDDYALEASQKKLMRILKDENKVRELLIDNPRRVLQGI